MTKQAYQEVTEKPTKITQGVQKITLQQTITRYLNTIEHDTINLSKSKKQNRNTYITEGVNREKAKALTKHFSDDGEPEKELSKNENKPRP